MKIALAVEDTGGLDAVISQHFGRCPYYTLVEVNEDEITNVAIEKNPFYENHGQPGQVPNFINELGAQVMIAGGMGPKAIEFFGQFGIQVVTGASGKTGEAVKTFLAGQLKGASSCSGHDHDNAGQLNKEVDVLKRELSIATEKLKSLEEK